MRGIEALTLRHIGRVSGTVSPLVGSEAHVKACAGSSPVPSAIVLKMDTIVLILSTESLGM